MVYSTYFSFLADCFQLRREIVFCGGGKDLEVKMFQKWLQRPEAGQMLGMPFVQGFWGGGSFVSPHSLALVTSSVLSSQLTPLPQDMLSVPATQGNCLGDLKNHIDTGQHLRPITSDFWHWDQVTVMSHDG